MTDRITSTLRDKLMNHRRVLCTGNPDYPNSLAQGFKKIFPSATFIHKSAGWDLTDESAEALQRLALLFKTHNTFINASYIAPMVQSKLLELCNQSVKFCDVFNIGSTHEFDGLGDKVYTESKLDLQKKSLSLHTYRFNTHHILLGSIKQDNTTEHRRSLDIDTVCNIVPWILSQNFDVPIICVSQFKQSW